MRGTLVVMAKRPVAGAVKTRLAAEIGVAAATAFQRLCLAATIRRLGRDRRWRTMLAVTPDHALDDRAFPPGIIRCAQGPGDLGQRMQRLMDRLPTGPVVIIGSDIPGILPADIAAAFDALGDADAVFGPADDGGYWLVGLRRRPRIPRPFTGVRWSGPHALADTLANCRGLTVALLRTRADVDDAAGWRAWRRQPSHRLSW